MAEQYPQIEAYENALEKARLVAENAKLQNVQQDVMMQDQSKSMISEQLDLGEELVRIDYLLRGYVLETDAKTSETKWTKPENNDMIILSEYGVHLIRNTIAWYLNKNTLLSNYDEQTINQKMEDFASDLNDTVFMEYEKVFQYPSFEDCQKILDERIERKKKLRIYAREILGVKISEGDKYKIEKEIIKQVEPIIDKEIEKIKEQIIKNKLKRFMLIIREVQDAVHSTYLRAWKGQERTTLRQHIHISETKGGVTAPQHQSSPNPLSWLRRK